jgi:hypothetical protein
MGKMKEKPRYNVLSFRVTDEELAEILAAMGRSTRQQFLLGAALEKVGREEDMEYRRRVDGALR